MFKPARMTRILVGGHRAHMQSVIDVLHAQGVVHLEDYRDPAGITGLGKPLPHGDAASALLLRARGLLKMLDAEGTAPGDEPADLPQTLHQAHEAIVPVADRITDLRATIHQNRSAAATLSPLDGLSVDLGALDVQSLRVFIGRVAQDPSPALVGAGIDHDVEFAEGAAVIMVRAEAGSDAERILAEHGFSAAQLPEGAAGTPRQAINTFTAAADAADADLEGTLEASADLAAAWAPTLAAAENILAASVERATAPLRFGVTPNTFHLEGWVQQDRLNHVKNVLAADFGDSLYLEDLGDAPIGAQDARPAAGDATADADGDGHDAHHEPSAAEEAPVKLLNKGLAQPYEYLLGLLGRPRYSEIDPTKLMLVFFPLFFGFMVGDLVIGLAIVFFGIYLKRHAIFGIGGPAVGRALLMGGVLAMVFGLFVFGEALGIHFVVSEHAAEEGELSWENILGLNIPDEGFLHKTGHPVAHGDALAGDHGDAPAGDSHAKAVLPPDGTAFLDGGHAYDVHATEGDEEHSGGILAPHGDTHLSLNGWVNLGYYSKIHDVLPLLVWSVMIGVTHLVLGLLIGFRNVYRSHGLSLAIQEKASWLGILAGVAMIAVGAMGMGPGFLTWAGAALFVVSVALLWMGVQHTVGVGFIAILEVPSLFGNILSYTRLAAIGASKAGMAIAFIAIANILTGGTLNVLWWIIYIIGMIVITLLAILSGGLQSLRLQFVEFFQKFYTGGGRPYLPFGRRAARPPSSP